ncbi:MAG: hypothetical protein RIQ89_1608, partial [Bacteroidota bacterium]
MVAKTRKLFYLLFIIVAALCYTIAPDRSEEANIKLNGLENLSLGREAEVILLRKNIQGDDEILKRLLFGISPLYEYIVLGSYTLDSSVLNYISINGDDTISINLPDALFAINPNAPLIYHKNITYELLSGESEASSYLDLQNQFIAQNVKKKNFWLGTDAQGRDLLSRYLVYTRHLMLLWLVMIFIFKSCNASSKTFLQKIQLLFRPSFFGICFFSLGLPSSLAVTLIGFLICILFANNRLVLLKMKFNMLTYLLIFFVQLYLFGYH